MKEGGCWIFLSHSNHDIEKVRLVRNEFERMGHNPLAFYLKCLSTDTERERKELDSLIKREIDAREWFVFCESPAAYQSPYVAEERAYIAKCNKEMIWTLNLMQDVESIRLAVRKICEQIEVFVSYIFADKTTADLLVDFLSKRDYSVWTADSKRQTEEHWEDQISEAIARCSYKGFYIILVSDASMKSNFFEQELGFAMNYSGGETVIPVLIGDAELPEQYRAWWKECHRIPKNPSREDILPIVDQMDTALKRYMKNTNNY